MSKQSIAIYGLSTETERALKKLTKEYEVVGLLDGFRENGEMYGYPIVSFDAMVAAGIKKIIVVARPGSCRAIANRIGDKCKKEQIELMDIRGKNLLENRRAVYDFSSVNGYTLDEAKREINTADVVSFDLFDTLVTRKVFFSSDVIKIMVAELEKEEKVLEASEVGKYKDFEKMRIASEKRLSKDGKAPRLFEIYMDMGYSLGEAKSLAQKEFETDLKLLCPREDVVALMKYAHCCDEKEYAESNVCKRKVYITSDTYYSYHQIETILKANGITEYDGLILSCERGTSKAGKLYDVLVRESGADHILHIGDDEVSDVEKLFEAGNRQLNSFRIFSPVELFDFVGGMNLEECISSLSDRIRVGMFIACVFNSPFQFEDISRKISIKNDEHIGYLMFAPIIMDFVIWFKHMVDKNGYSEVLFCARDGYLIKRLYEMIACDWVKNDSNLHYYLTSRIAAIRAGVNSIEDIEYVDGMKFSGDIFKNLKCRFGIDLNRENIDESGSLHDYSDIILKASKDKRKNNLEYIKSLKIGTGKVAFFDFVAKGTSQMYAEKLIENELCGLYFMQLEPEFMKDKNLNIVPFVSESEREESTIFDDYYILETILTSPDPSLEEFDSEGRAIYAKETRSSEDIECVMNVQKGIENYVKEYLEICFGMISKNNEGVINKKLDEVLLKLIHCVDISASDFAKLTVEDPFFNRKTEVCDLI